MHVFGLPGIEHLLAERVFAKRGDIMHGQRLRAHLTGDIDRGVERIAAKAAVHLRAFFRQFNHAFANHGNLVL